MQELFLLGDSIGSIEISRGGRARCVSPIRKDLIVRERGDHAGDCQVKKIAVDNTFPCNYQIRIPRPVTHGKPPQDSNLTSHPIGHAGLTPNRLQPTVAQPVPRRRPRHATPPQSTTVDSHPPRAKAIRVNNEIITLEELKQRINYIHKVMTKVSTERILTVLKQCDFHIKRTIEFLTDELMHEAAQLATSQMLANQSIAILESQLGNPSTANVSFYSKYDESIVYVPTPTGRRKALLIGINYYGTHKELNGCVDDVFRMKNLISKVYGYSDNPLSMTILTDKKGHDPRLLPTRRNCIGAMRWLVADARPGDILFFQYSGHGGQKKDLSGTEVDGFDETIMPVDYKTAGHITDDELHDILVKDLPAGVKLVCVMDCCHSGSGMDLPYFITLDDNSLKKSYNQIDRIWKEELFPKHSKGDVVLISSCQDSETAADLLIPGWGAGGAVTLGLVTTLTNAKDPHEMTYLELFKTLSRFLSDRKFKQRPQLSATKRFNPRTSKFNFFASQL